MNKNEVQKLYHGLYRIYWKESEGGGASLAAVGSKEDGTRWLCCTNWISAADQGTDGHGEKIWSKIERVELIARHTICGYCSAGSAPYIHAYSRGETIWRHEGGVLCATPERNCTCHLGSVCTQACQQGEHHDGCARRNQ